MAQEEEKSESDINEKAKNTCRAAAPALTLRRLSPVPVALTGLPMVVPCRPYRPVRRAGHLSAQGISSDFA
jgi:hypothetical protein